MSESVNRGSGNDMTPPFMIWRPNAHTFHAVQIFSVFPEKFYCLQAFLSFTHLLKAENGTFSQDLFHEV